MMNQFSSSVSLNAADATFWQALYGPLPELGEVRVSHALHTLVQTDRSWRQWRLELPGHPQVAWTLHLAWPAAPEAPEARQVLLSPDGCWPHVLDRAAIDAVLGEGLALAWFNRCEIAPDVEGSRSGPLQGLAPADSGALAMWAWGLQRSAQALRGLLQDRLAGLAVIGHSRGGKAALLAAALDPRIDAVVSHNSGTGGASCLGVAGAGSESLAELAQRFAHWLAPGAQSAHVQAQLIEAEVPAQLWARIAPRGLLVQQAQDDAWANPAGTRALLARLAPHWSAAPERLVLRERAGGHAMTAADWQAAACLVRQALTRANAHHASSPERA